MTVPTGFSKQWPGAGLVYPGRETELLVNGDFLAWTPNGAYFDPDNWTVTNPATAANHVTENPTGHIQVVSDGAFVGVAKASGFVVGKQYRCMMLVTAVALGTGAVAGAGVYKSFTVPGMYDFKFIADTTSLSLKRAGGTCDFTVDYISIWTNPPGYTPFAGDPMYIDNIQTALTVASQTSGLLSNTGLTIVSGTWSIIPAGTGQAISCVGNGVLKRRLLGADGFTTKRFTETGGVALAKNAADFTLTATAGDTISVLVLTAP